MTSRNGSPYEVVRSRSFITQWEDGIGSGRIPPGRDALLDRICSNVLAKSPRIGATRPGKPSNYRTILIPRLTHRTPEIEIGYTIIEDDKKVQLEEVVRTSND